MNNDTIINIAYAKNRKSLAWRNQTIKWSQLVDHLKKSKETDETIAEFLKMPKAKQDIIKDVGGFVGGYLEDGIRRNTHIKYRTLLTLDIDYARENSIQQVKDSLDCSMVIYSTHKHTPEHPRLRLVIPLTKATTPDEYQAVARKIASKIDIEIFDPSTFEPARMMYWASHPRDVVPIFEFKDASILNPDLVLAEYENWTDTQEWAHSIAHDIKRITKSNAKQKDPIAKKGIIGAFCRAYSIPEAIATFLSDVYTKGVDSTRYSYTKGSTANGLVVYDDKFAYSNHGTDPASGLLCNAFDLVRIHKWGSLDVGTSSDTPTMSLPSYKQAVATFKSLAKVKRELATDSLEAMQSELKNMIDIDPDKTDHKKWLEKLTYSNNGTLQNTLANILLILQNDTKLKGLVRYNQLTKLIDLTPKAKQELLKGSDSEQLTEFDTAAISHRLSDVWSLEVKNKLDDAIKVDARSRQYHPIKDLIEKDVWDGIPRIDTLLIDYLGAADNSYTRAVTHKTLIAMIKRIYEPGCKYDQVLTLTGKQGCGKSTFAATLGGEYFNESLPDVQGAKAYEALQGAWVVELSEMAPFRKKDREAIKSFISAQSDTYRKAYARYVVTNKRQCIFIGTTNENDFLKDDTGNRRYWIVEVAVNTPVKNVWRDMNTEISQIYAEAYQLYKNGDRNINILSEIDDATAIRNQNKYLSISNVVDELSEFLETEIPATWDDLSKREKQEFLDGGELERVAMLKSYGTSYRDKIRLEDLTFEFYGMRKNHPKYRSQSKVLKAAIEKVGWEYTRIKIKGVPTWGFKKP